MPAACAAAYVDTIFAAIARAMQHYEESAMRERALITQRRGAERYDSTRVAAGIDVSAPRCYCATSYYICRA